MTASTSAVVERLAALVSGFNRGGLDLPDDFLDRNAQFRLNGRSYEESVGTAADPLVRLIARGPGGYRFLARALRYAVPDARVELGSLTRRTQGDGFLLEGPATLTGALRGSSERLSVEGRILLTFDATPHLTDVAIALDPAQVTRIAAARASTS